MGLVIEIVQAIASGSVGLVSIIIGSQSDMRYMLMVLLRRLLLGLLCLLSVLIGLILLHSVNVAQRR